LAAASPGQPLQSREASCVSLLLFVGPVKIKPGLNVRTVPKATFPLGLGQRLAATITPSAFDQELVPNLDLFCARSATVRKTPLQDLLVGATAQAALDKRRVVHPKEASASGVEPAPIGGPKIIAGRQPARGLQANLVEHPTKEHDAAHLFTRAA